MIEFPIPVLGFVAWSGTGKTTLLKKLIPILRERGLRIALVKHAHHDFDIDHPGKDSHTLREAGASQVVIASRHRIASIREIEGNASEPSLKDSLTALQTDEYDLVLVEGFKMEDIHKVELHRSSLNSPYLYTHDPNIIALADDSNSKTVRREIKCLDLGNLSEIANFVEKFVSGQLRESGANKEASDPEQAACSIH